MDGAEFKEGDWKYWNYLQESSRYFDLRRIDAQVNEYLKAKKAREDELSQQEIQLWRPSPEDDDDIIEGEETAEVQLDSGEVVTIPVRFLQPRGRRARKMWRWKLRRRHNMKHQEQLLRVFRCR